MDVKVRSDDPTDLYLQVAAEISGPIAVRLSGLPPVEHEEFRLRASVAAGSSAPNPTGPAGPFYGRTISAVASPCTNCCGGTDLRNG